MPPLQYPQIENNSLFINFSLTKCLHSDFIYTLEYLNTVAFKFFLKRFITSSLSDSPFLEILTYRSNDKFFFNFINHKNNC